MKNCLISLGILLLVGEVPGNILDTFDDGIINDHLWNVIEDGGTVVENEGVATFFLYEFHASQASCASILQLKEALPTNLDFEITADFLYQYEMVDDITYGIIIKHLDSASFVVSPDNYMGTTAHGEFSDQYFQGPFVNNPTNRFKLNYHASSGSFEFLLYSGGIESGSITLSITGSGNHDLSADWDLSAGNQFEIWIVAEKYSEALPQSQVTLDSLEIVMIPEPRGIAATFAILVLVVISFTRKHNVPLRKDG